MPWTLDPLFKSGCYVSGEILVLRRKKTGGEVKKHGKKHGVRKPGSLEFPQVRTTQQ